MVNLFGKSGIEVEVQRLLRSHDLLGAAQFQVTTDIRIVNALIKSLSDTNIYMRTRAVHALLRTGELGILQSTRLLRSPDPEIRRLAVQVVGSVGRLVWYDHAPINDLRDKIIKAAGQSLIDLTRDPETSVRRRAIKALVKLRHPDAEQALSAALNDRDWTIRRDAAKALERLRGS